jgi:peroxiredoxin
MMRSGSSVVVLVAALAVVASAVARGQGDSGAPGAKLGREAPSFTLIDTQGQERSLSDYKGRIIVLEWFNTDCPFVQKRYETKAMQNALKKAKELDRSVAWLAINSTHDASAEANNYWIRKYGLQYPILLDTDGRVGRLYDARKTPHMFVIDREGILRYQGAIDNNQLLDKSGDDLVNYVVNAVCQITRGETVAPDYVPPYGCTVKFRG